MSEFVSSWHFSEYQQKERLTEVGNTALAIVDATYGEGYPNYENQGSQELAYHNGHHARAVGNLAFELCTTSDLAPILCETARTAGFAHDEKQLLGRGLDEQESANWLERQLSQDNIVTPSLRSMATLAILGTEPLFEDGKLVGQKATTMQYPSKEAETLSLSVASADLGELYTPQGPLLAHQLFREINNMAQPEDLSMEKLAAFQRNQVDLLERYHYPLAEAETKLTALKPEVISYSTALINKIERGEIDSWQQVLELDKQFASQVS